MAVRSSTPYYYLEMKTVSVNKNNTVYIACQQNKSNTIDDIIPYAFFIKGNPIFVVKSILSYRFDFSTEGKFIQKINEILSPMDGDITSFTYFFREEAPIIMRILDLLSRDDKYEKLHISKLKHIVIRNSCGYSVVLTNNSIYSSETTPDEPTHTLNSSFPVIGLEESYTNQSRDINAMCKNKSRHNLLIQNDILSEEFNNNYESMYFDLGTITRAITN